MSLRLITTEDNSHTVYSEQYGAHYHSIFGALEESIHVFISAGLYHLYRQGRESISICEMGFGTGLNAMLSAIESEQLNLNINYCTIESDPIPISQALELNYSKILSSDGTEEIHALLHKAEWSKEIEIKRGFKFKKIKGKLEEIDLPLSFDLIYYDAFAPSCQPHLWTEDIHSKLHESLNQNGVLVTYCTQGAFRRVLEKLGYKIERLNGPGRKREMLRATKISV